MESITIYHGSQNIIQQPMFGLGNPKNDYGLAGWSLAYYQWFSGQTFKELYNRGIRLSNIIAMFYPLHEADLSTFCERMEISTMLQIVSAMLERNPDLRKRSLRRYPEFQFD